MLDLPQPENSSSSSTTTLDRKGSLTGRITSNDQNQPTALGSTSSPTFNSGTLPGSTLITTTGATINANNNDSLSLPSLAFSASSPGVSGTYPVTSPATSVGSTLRQGSVTGLTSPPQSKHAPNFGGDAYGASRLRQTTNSTTGTISSEYSSNPSTVSFGLGSAGRGLGIGGFANDGVFGPTPNDNAGPGGLLGGNNNAFNPRRDSGYGPSIYNNSPGIGFGPLGGDRRDSRSAVSTASLRRLTSEEAEKD